MIAAQGVPARTIRQALKVGSKGIKYKILKQKRGKAMSFIAAIKKTTGFEMRFFKLVLARRIPKINMQRGVVIEPMIPMAFASIEGIYFPSPKK